MFSTVPGHSVVIEVPDAWLATARVEGFAPSSMCFHFVPNEEWPVSQLSFAEIDPPVRNTGVVGLDCDRSQSILNAFRTNCPLPAIEVDMPPGVGTRYRVRDGFHRYYLAAAMGYIALPVSIRPYFNIYSC